MEEKGLKAITFADEVYAVHGGSAEASNRGRGAGRRSAARGRAPVGTAKRPVLRKLLAAREVRGEADRGVYDNTVEQEDMTSWSVLGLLDAIEIYSSDRQGKKAKFESYAISKIR